MEDNFDERNEFCEQVQQLHYVSDNLIKLTNIFCKQPCEPTTFSFLGKKNPCYSMIYRPQNTQKMII